MDKPIIFSRDAKPRRHDTNTTWRRAD